MTARARVALLGLALTMGGVGGCDDESEDPFEELELVMREDANLPPVEPFDADAAAACGVALSTINGGRELNRVVNGQTIPSRAAMQDLVLDEWPRLGNGVGSGNSGRLS